MLELVKLVMDKRIGQGRSICPYIVIIKGFVQKPVRQLPCGKGH